MNKIITGADLSEKEKSTIFWASFLSLAAAGVSLAFRIAMGGVYGSELGLTNLQIGQIVGAQFWPVAITMIGFSLVVDRTGYKAPMFAAAALQIIGGLGTFFAGSFGTLYLFAVFMGLGHGIVEAVINPVCAAIYPKEKTKWLAILHAAWPAGLISGSLMIFISKGIFIGWAIHALWIAIPAVIYGFMLLKSVFPVDERVQAGVPFMDMLKQVGFLTATVACGLLTYEIGNVLPLFTSFSVPENWFTISMILGLIMGGAFGLYTKSLGQPIFFLLCLLMLPIATAELGTDSWIQKLMTPVVSGFGIDPIFSIIFSASIMMILRLQAGTILKFGTPVTILCVSGLFSAVGLFWLSSASGLAILIAFIIYALGQTFYWPCILGFTSERYPQGGALTLNTVSALGLLFNGIIGAQVLGVAFDNSIHSQITEKDPIFAEAASQEKSFLWMKNDAIIPELKDNYINSTSGASADEQNELNTLYSTADVQAGRDVLRFATIFPGILFIVFGGLVFYFNSIGGYKPINLINENKATKT